MEFSAGLPSADLTGALAAKDLDSWRKLKEQFWPGKGGLDLLGEAPHPGNRGYDCKR